jgi:hypothetical protein
MRLLGKLGQDPLVGSLLILYNLHPEPFEARLERAFDKIRTILRKQGATLQVLAAGEALIQLRIVGSPGQDLQTPVREALLESVPDAAEIVIEGGQKPQSGFVPLESLVGFEARP